jgi:Flp pilus assembly protein TadD
VYTYPKFRYDPHCRPYSSGVYLSYETDVYVAADPPRSLTCEAPAVRVIDATDAGPTEIGFKLLAAGEYSRALSFFADASSRDLDEPMSKLGYSLASAAQGNDDRALWAMQRAVEADAAELPSWPACGELRKLVETLKDRYQAKADRYVHTPDREALFMVAALNHVTGDREGAQAALARAYPGGSDFYTPATRALAEAVEGSVEVATSN